MDGSGRAISFSTLTPCRSSTTRPNNGRSSETVEESAKTRGDLGDANDAHYALLASKTRPCVGSRVLDLVFYRGIAGYFVRPFRPPLVLLVLAMVFSFLRFARGASTSEIAEATSRLRRFGARTRARNDFPHGRLPRHALERQSGSSGNDDERRASASGSRSSCTGCSSSVPLSGSRTRTRPCARCLTRSSERAILSDMGMSAVAFGLAGLAAAGVGLVAHGPRPRRRCASRSSPPPVRPRRQGVGEARTADAHGGRRIAPGGRTPRGRPTAHRLGRGRATLPPSRNARLPHPRQDHGRVLPPKKPNVLLRLVVADDPFTCSAIGAGKDWSSRPARGRGS